MATIPKDYELKSDDNDPPVLWAQPTQLDVTGIQVTTELLETWLGDGKAMKLKSFLHDDEGVHFLLTAKGTTLHTDRAYARYSHQLVIRNDGSRLRGFTDERDHRKWHIPMQPGVLYCLDTHSPHQGLRDPRMFRTGPGFKVVIAVDRHEPLEPDAVVPLVSRLLGEQLADWDSKGKHVRTAKASF